MLSRFLVAYNLVRSHKTGFILRNGFLVPYSEGIRASEGYGPQEKKSYRFISLVRPGDEIGKSWVFRGLPGEDGLKHFTNY